MLTFLDMMFAANVPFTLAVPSNIASPKFRQMALAAGWDGYNELIIDITAPLVNTVRFEAGESYPQGVTLRIGPSTRVGGVSNSGTAIYTRVAISIDNKGIISGGGGAGGTGQAIYVTSDVPKTVIGYGGGGGVGQGFASASVLSIVGPGAGGQGNYVETPNVGGVGTPPAWARGGQGGAGGAWGQAGSYGGAGSWGNGTGGVQVLTGPGGAAGKYIDGNSHVTWINEGTRLGTYA